jgi:hypothetical protein
VALQGTLRTGIVAIGGETTGVILQTPGATYELDLGNNPALLQAAEALNGQTVNVTGSLTVQHGVEIPERTIVHVDSLSATPSFSVPTFPVPFLSVTDALFAHAGRVGTVYAL